MTDENPAVAPGSIRDVYNMIDTVNKIDDNKEKDNGVYVLECVQYLQDDDEMREHLKQRHTPDVDDSPTTWRYPNEYDRAIFADVVYYVGESSNVSRRIKDHISMQGSTLTKGFPPRSIERIEWVDSREAALEREDELLDELGNIDEMPSYMGWKVSNIPNDYEVAYRNVKKVFPSRLGELSETSEKEVRCLSHAIRYAKKQDGILLSDTEDIRRIATERVKQLKKKEPEKIVSVHGG